MREWQFGLGCRGFGTISGWLLPFIPRNLREETNCTGVKSYTLFMVLHPFFFMPSFMPSFAKPLPPSICCNGRHGTEVLGLEGAGGGRPHLALLCEGHVGGEWRTEHFPLILPDSPGAWEVGCL